MSTQLNSIIKFARETGQPHLIVPAIANLMGQSNEAYNQLAANQIELDNKQSDANAIAANENEKNRYVAEQEYAKTLDDINLRRSELLGKMTTDLVSTIPGRYMRNEAMIADQDQMIKSYKWFVSRGHEMTFEDFKKNFYGTYYQDKNNKSNYGQNTNEQTNEGGTT